MVTDTKFYISLYFEDLRLKSGVVIPAGAILVVPVQLVQMDDSSWGNDASKFNPYRFLSKTENIYGSPDIDTSNAGSIYTLSTIYLFRFMLLFTCQF